MVGEEQQEEEESGLDGQEKVGQEKVCSCMGVTAASTQAYMQLFALNYGIIGAAYVIQK